MGKFSGYTNYERINKFGSLEVEELYPTIQKVGGLRHGLDVNAHFYHQLITTGDTVDGLIIPSVDSTRIIGITATAHGAREGDLIRITSGNSQYREIKVYKVRDVNSFYISEPIVKGQIANGDTFDILRPTQPRVNSSGDLIVAVNPFNIQFQLDGADQIVTEDTLVPANNAPLPVKLTNVTGDINITAGDLNVQTSHIGVNYDSIRIGDGTTLLGINTDGSINTKDKRDLSPDYLFRDLSVGNINTGAAQVVITATADAKGIDWVNNSGFNFELWINGSRVGTIPKGSSKTLDITLLNTQTIALASIGANATGGELTINVLR